MTAPPLLALTEIAFSDADFRSVAALAQARFGLNLSEAKKPLVQSRLTKRLRAREIDNFPAYLALLDRREEEEERRALVSVLTTNVTSFFREAHHFDMLRETCLPPLLEDLRSGGRLRLWSAGCSSGQEAYSMAMTLLELDPAAAEHDLRILATDIDPQIIDRARRGLYPPEEASGLPGPCRARWTEETGPAGALSMAPTLRGLITFAELNLMDPWPFQGPFDIIFCRNVAIYFNQQTQAQLWQRFAGMLAPGGYLFIGHSERLTGPATQALSVTGITSYRKAPDRRTGPQNRRRL